MNLSNITAPRPARRGAGNTEATQDEPCAWASREFLRKKIVGKEVLFTVETTTNTGREYGYVYLGDGEEADVSRTGMEFSEPNFRLGCEGQQTFALGMVDAFCKHHLSAITMQAAAAY